MRERLREAWEREVAERFREGLKSLDIILWVAVAVNATLLTIAFWESIVAILGPGGVWFFLGLGVAVFFFLLFTGEEVYLVEEPLGDVTDPVKQHLGYLPFWRKPYTFEGKTAIRVGICPRHEVVLLWGDWKPPYVVRSFLMTKVYGRIERTERMGLWAKRIYVAPLFPKKVSVPVTKRIKVKTENPGGEREVLAVVGYREVDFSPDVLTRELRIASATAAAYERNMEELRREIENLRREAAEVYRAVAETSAAVRDSGIVAQRAFVEHTKEAREIVADILGISVYSLSALLREMRNTVRELKELRGELRGAGVPSEEEEEEPRRKRKKKGEGEEE